MTNLVVFGKELSEDETKGLLEEAPSFVVEHAGRIRCILDKLARLSLVDIDQRVGITIDDSADEKEKALAAWEILSWNYIFKPFSHASRGYFFNPARYLDLLQKNADALYLFGILVVKTPDEKIYEALRSLHVETAEQYLDYAKHFTAAETLLGEMDWLTTW